MAETSRFWDGTSIGDSVVAPYDAGTEFAQVMMAMSGADGLTNKGGITRDALNALLPSSPAANTLRIASGHAQVYGTWYENSANVDTTIPTPTTSTRIDRIVLRKSWSAQTVRITRIAGTEGAAAPALVQTIGTTWDFPLCQVSITVGAVITITDERVSLGSTQKIAETILTASASSIDFSSIPSTFRHLRLLIYGRGDEAAATSLLQVRFNADTAGNYDYQLDAGTGGVTQAVENQGVTAIRVGSLSGNTAGANLFAQCDVLIPHYANTLNNKVTSSVYGVKWGAVAGQLIAANGAGFWRSNSAINQITILPGAGNIVAGSIATLYGLSN